MSRERKGTAMGAGTRAFLEVEHGWPPLKSECRYWLAHPCGLQPNCLSPIPKFNRQDE
jgi:hypothetical protein